MRAQGPFAIVVLVPLGCAGGAASGSAAEPAPAPRAGAEIRTTLGAPAAPAPSVSVAPAASTPITRCAESNGGRLFSRVYDKPVHDVATGKPGRVAIATDEGTLLLEGATWRTTDPARTPLGVRLFFGRDNQPRRMGSARAEGGLRESRYERYRQGRWARADDEVGPLARSVGGLYGVLGYEDPEIVCAPMRFCLEKRTSGWVRTAAVDAPAQIVVASGKGYALHEDRVEVLTDGKWIPLEPHLEVRAPESVWASPEGDIWVVAGGAALHRTASHWETAPVPLPGVRAVLGTSLRDVWFAAAAGAARFDGATFTCVPGLTGPLAQLRFDGENLWLAGESGLWRGAPEGVAAPKP